MLDTTDVPLLFGMLYSSSDENWKKERGWMIRFLADGMVGSEDWRVLKRRHTWDLLASLFQSADGSQDGALRMGILEVRPVVLPISASILTCPPGVGKLDMQCPGHGLPCPEISSFALDRDAAFALEFEVRRSGMDQNSRKYHCHR